MPQKMPSFMTKLISWLDACNIPYQLDPELKITTSDGSLRTVKYSESDLTSDDLYLNIEIFSNLVSETAMTAFHLLTEAAGYGSPTPVSRGKTPSRGKRDPENFDLIAFRHQEFRRVPNLPAHRIQKYSKVMDIAYRNFHRWNHDLCRRHGMEVEDLKSYVYIWTCNFVGLYERPVESNTNENFKLLHNFLLQRFAEFRRLLYKRARSSFPSYSTVATAFPTTETEDEIPNDEYRAKKDQIRVSPESNARKKIASNLLTSLLNQLPHDVMIEKLKSVAEASKTETYGYLDPGAVAEARKRLKAHYANCPNCESFQVNEEIAAMDEFCPVEGLEDVA